MQRCRAEPKFCGRNLIYGNAMENGNICKPKLIIKKKEAQTRSIAVHSIFGKLHVI